MIGRLRGVVVERQPPRLLLDVAGVGYELEAPMSTFYQLPAIGGETTLLTHMLVREDAQLLYGFSSEAERRLFRALIRISGIGPRLALTILSGMAADHFVRCIRDGDSAMLVRLPGIGKKSAERLIIEMRDRLSDWEMPADRQPDPMLLTPHSRALSDTALHPSSSSGARRDALSALQALGYKEPEALRLIRAVDDQTELDSEGLIRAALKQAIRA